MSPVFDLFATILLEAMSLRAPASVLAAAFSILLVASLVIVEEAELRRTRDPAD